MLNTTSSALFAWEEQHTVIKTDNAVVTLQMILEVLPVISVATGTTWDSWCDYRLACWH